MKKLLIGLFIFGLFAVYGQAYASNLELISTDSGKSFNVTGGQSIKVTLSNPGDGGYTFDSPIYDNTILQLVNNRHIDPVIDTVNPIMGNFGSDYWEFVAIKSGNTNLKITASRSWVGGGTATMFSANITVSTITTPSIVVTSPNNGGESVEFGGKIEIRWMSPNITSALNEIYVSDGTNKGHTESVRMENNLGSVIYTLDSNLIPGSNYKAYVSTAYGSAISVSDSSDLPFTIKSTSTNDGCPTGSIYSSATGQICPINTTPKLTLISPNGGENFKIGDQVKIKWNSENLPVGALIAVYLEEPATNSKYGIGDLLTNDGEETISLTPAAGISNYGKNFKINIVYTVDKQRELGGDSSDGLLTISSPSSDSGCSNGQIYSSTTGQKCTVVVPVCPSMTLLNCAIGTHQVYSGKDPSGCDSYVCTKVPENTGCSNGQVYSSTTGNACPKIVEEYAGCYGDRYSQITGKACPLSMVTDEGCKAGQTYSSTTGQKCIQAIIQTVDQGCNGNKYSTTTGNMCPIATIKIDEGCLPGQNYSSTTGQKCTSFITQTNTARRTLRWGLSGDDVKALQKNLGLSSTDGIYGTWTMTKVKEWQTKNGLYADGIFGPGSQSKMGL